MQAALLEFLKVVAAEKTGHAVIRWYSPDGKTSTDIDVKMSRKVDPIRVSIDNRSAAFTAPDEAVRWCFGE